MYPSQLGKLLRVFIQYPIPDDVELPDELLACQTCRNNAKYKTEPSRTFWNLIQLDKMPEEIKVLKWFEKRLISRVKLHRIVTRLPGACGQFASKGKSTLFEQDISEINDQLFSALPSLPEQSDIVIVIVKSWKTSTNTRRYLKSVSPECMTRALLVKNQ